MVSTKATQPLLLENQPTTSSQPACPHKPLNSTHTSEMGGAPRSAFDDGSRASNQKSYYGTIDCIDKNLVHGWFYSGENFPEIPTVVLRTKTGDKTFACDIYREDLNKASFNHGYCGFRIPIELELGEEFDILSSDLKWKIPKNSEQCLHSNEGESEVKQKLYDTVHHTHVRDPRKESKVAVYSAFLPDPSYYSYHKETINNLRSLGFLVILVIPVNQRSPYGREFNAELYSHADVIIVRKNFGYDFGSYATGIAYAFDNYDVSQLVLINDSIIGSGGSPTFLNEIIKEDFWGITESFQRAYHIQSYCFGFNLHSEHVRDAVRGFFFGRGFLYTNEKPLVIARFEVAMTKYFSRLKIKPYVLLPHEDLYKSFIDDSYYKNPQFSTYFTAARDTVKINISHVFWREAIKLGFPFVKKELITANPTKYPQLNNALYDTLPYDKLISIIRELG